MPIQANATCVGGTGPDLSAYVHLVYAPQQHGDFIACQSNGTPIENIKAAVADSPAGTTTQQIADQFGVSVAEVMDALRYEGGAK